ncbi:hypothetical protein GUITHDRAFT_121133 [Guillardia theta CCMP2712]|uniref:3-hydroxyacyl-CoA dehydrogenase C-terminal domain-containing protein n=1 Tax=Guillardia theta (strain CCMP2712) TaxID=905079 RepID=L1I8Y2_GUITC|nr:hypothetical protein GUITHDRAFT_121133 [Guillardia theta CCMP2712]EKX32693.1 hypothetical protein GUITHDRAFT_121133 [Guillardia theta CCMP2712]|eukprot:XP_005819673.1 hypothetical protein GUITHDRAFT_121133 [Guillardia theta CCMP2712]
MRQFSAFRFLTPLPANLVKLYQDGVIRSAQDGDVAAIFGVGFPPFTGGPKFRYVDRIGVSKYVDELNRLADKHGARFSPAPLLVDMAKQGKKFHQ